MIKTSFIIRTYWISECATITTIRCFIQSLSCCGSGVDEAMLPEEALVAPKYLSAQDLILMSDVVITDYSNIIFDAMAIDKTVALYTQITVNILSLKVLTKIFGVIYQKFGIQTDNY